MNGENLRFLNDPIEYCRTTVLNLQGKGGGVTADFNANNPYATMFVDLVPWEEEGFFKSIAKCFGFGEPAGQVIFTPSEAPPDGDSPIEGFYAPYRMYGEYTSGSAAQRVRPEDVMIEVDKNDPEHRFIFTGGQNGCSLLLLDLGVPGKYTAFHYPNSDGRGKQYPLLKGMGAKVVLDSHFDLYGIRDQPNAASFFYHDGNRWTLIYQPQTQFPATYAEMQKYGRPKMGLRMEAPAQHVDRQDSWDIP